MAMLTAETKFGVVRGVPGHNGKSTVFKGIPYAKPPVGELRFAPPVPCDPWEGELLCDHFQASPLQEGAPRREIPVISEDCLYLNIWTPAETGEEKLPVLFWVYGGGFVTGSGTEPEFGGEALNEKGAIVVTFNYRLSVMGFLALPQLLERDGVTGNSGLRDQMSALKWVHENIAAFGGDPDNITVFGFSAGGMSTRMLAVSPMSRDMIKRIIVQSGGGVTDSDYYRPLKEKMEICERGMARLGWDMEDLRTRDGMEIMKRLQEATITELEGWEKSVFQPDVDGITLMDTPGVSLWKGDYNDIPILAGSVTGDNGWIKIVRNEVEDETMIPAFVYSRSVAWAQRNAEAGRTPIYSYHF
ncbi:MAG: carboxylesterase family protein, partial [Lachnospiraceae bacterium]|nr:carboxylesterase family protein [Lachnospiraceae bacterium]